MTKPWTVMQEGTIAGTDMNIVGFGQDYFVVKFGDRCPTCNYGEQAIKFILEFFSNHNVVFVHNSICNENLYYRCKNVLLLKESDPKTRLIFPVKTFYHNDDGAYQAKAPETFQAVLDRRTQLMYMTPLELLKEKIITSGLLTSRQVIPLFRKSNITFTEDAILRAQIDCLGESIYFLKGGSNQYWVLNKDRFLELLSEDEIALIAKIPRLEDFTNILGEPTP